MTEQPTDTTRSGGQQPGITEARIALTKALHAGRKAANDGWNAALDRESNLQAKLATAEACSDRLHAELAASDADWAVVDRVAVECGWATCASRANNKAAYIAARHRPEPVVDLPADWAINEAMRRAEADWGLADVKSLSPDRSTVAKRAVFELAREIELAKRGVVAPAAGGA